MRNAELNLLSLSLWPCRATNKSIGHIMWIILFNALHDRGIRESLGSPQSAGSSVSSNAVLAVLWKAWVDFHGPGLDLRDNTRRLPLVLA